MESKVSFYNKTWWMSSVDNAISFLLSSQQIKRVKKTTSMEKPLTLVNSRLSHQTIAKFKAFHRQPGGGKRVQIWKVIWGNRNSLRESRHQIFLNLNSHGMAYVAVQLEAVLVSKTTMFKLLATSHLGSKSNPPVRTVTPKLNLIASRTLRLSQLL
jgi:hypothetical protein